MTAAAYAPSNCTHEYCHRGDAYLGCLRLNQPTIADRPIEKLTRDELVAEREQLQSEILHIEVELGSDRKYHGDGTMMADAEYHRWRHSAKSARVHRLNRMRAIKERLKVLEPEAGTTSDRMSADGRTRIELLVSIDTRLSQVVDLLGKILEAQFEPEV